MVGGNTMLSTQPYFSKSARSVLLTNILDVQFTVSDIHVSGTLYNFPSGFETARWSNGEVCKRSARVYLGSRSFNLEDLAYVCRSGVRDTNGQPTNRADSDFERLRFVVCNPETLKVAAHHFLFKGPTTFIVAAVARRGHKRHVDAEGQQDGVDLTISFGTVPHTHLSSKKMDELMRQANCGDEKVAMIVVRTILCGQLRIDQALNVLQSRKQLNRTNRTVATYLPMGLRR